MSVLICPECGAENPADTHRCQKCGTVLQDQVSRLQWAMVGALIVAIAGLLLWRSGVLEHRNGSTAPVAPFPQTMRLETAGPVSAESTEGGVRIEFPSGRWQINGRDSEDKIIKNPAAEFEFIDQGSFAFGLLIIEETPLSLDGFTDLALNQFRARYTSFQLSDDRKSVLGGQPARYVEFQVVSSQDITFRYFVHFLVRNGKGYQFVFYTIPSLVEDLQSDLKHVWKSVTFAG